MKASVAALGFLTFFVFLPQLSSEARADHHGGGVHRFVLTSASTAQHTDSFSVTSDDLGLTTGGRSWSVRKRTLVGGRQQGSELITIDNGTLTITVIPTRGMGILEVRHGDVRLGWNSPVKEVVHPHFMNLDSRGGLGWLEGFNEWMVRCGLEFAGHPGKDEFVTNTGDTATMDLSLHGKVGNIPASEVEVLIDKAPPHRIRVRGVVHETMFYGPKLRLVAEVSTVPGSTSFRFHDTVKNLGGADQEFTMIYHGNYGRPLLEAGAKVHVPAKKIAPMNGKAAGALDNYGTYAGPTEGFIEEVFLFEPYADADGRTTVVLQNAAGNRGTSASWRIDEIPYVTVWKNCAAEADGYVTGIEPGTCFPFNRRVERKAGRLPKLAPGASRSFTLDYDIHVGESAVDKAVARVKAIQAGRVTTVEREVPSTD